MYIILFRFWKILRNPKKSVALYLPDDIRIEHLAIRHSKLKLFSPKNWIKSSIDERNVAIFLPLNKLRHGNPVNIELEKSSKVVHK